MNEALILELPTFVDQAPDQQSDHNAVEVYIANLDQLDPEERESSLLHLRLKRRIGSFEVKPGDEACMIDDAIVAHIENGDIASVAPLITPSFMEKTRLEDAYLRTHPGAHLQSEPSWLGIEDIVTQKAIAFTRALDEHLIALDEDLREMVNSEVRVRAADPESALKVPASFWANFNSLSESAQTGLLDTESPLDVTAGVLDTLSRSGLLSWAKELTPHVAAMSDETDREEHVASLARALPKLPGINAWDASRLAMVQAPDAVIDIAIQLYPNKTSEQALTAVWRELGIPYDQQLPYEIPQADIRIMEAAHAICNDQSLPEQIKSSIVTGILSLAERHADLQIPLLEALEGLAGIAAYDSQYPLNHDKLSNKLYGELQDVLQKNSRPEGDDGAQRLRLFIAKARMVSKSYNYIVEDITKVRDNESQEESDSELYDAVKEMEELGLKYIFDEIPLPGQLDAKLSSIWTQFSALGYVRQTPTDEIKDIKDLTDDDIRMGAIKKVDILFKQALAVQRYVEQYGTDELVKLHETFNIVNFVRGEPEQFHDQLTRWEGLTDVPVNIEVAAFADHNFAYGEAAKSFFEFFGTEGSYYFEAADSTQLARAFVSVGNRDRLAGRDPLETPTVETVIIAGHGSPESVQLDWNAFLDLASYVEAMIGRNRLHDKGGNVSSNNYRRHLGNKFRVIMSACSAAGRSKWGINISQLIRTTHSVPVDGPPRITYGMELTREGEHIKVMYKDKRTKSGEIPLMDSTHYGV